LILIMFCLTLKNFFVYHISIHITVLESKCWHSVFVRNFSVEKSALHTQKAVFRPYIFLAPPTGMFIGTGAATEFPQIGSFKMGHILPVPVAITEINIFELIQKLPDFIAFVFKS